MLSLGLELGLPLSCCLYDLGNDCKGPRSIGQTFSRFSRNSAGSARAQYSIKNRWRSGADLHRHSGIGSARIWE